MKRKKLLPIAWMVVVPETRIGGPGPVTCFYYKEDQPKAHAALGDKVTPLYALTDEQIAIFEKASH